MKNKNAAYLAQGAMIAALYVVLTLFINAFNLASGAIQVRISEALTILPVFTSTAVPGLFIGCILANILGGNHILDVVFGSLATLLGAIGTRKLRNAHPLLAPVPPIVANTIVVPFVLKYAYGLPASVPFMMLTVCIGEALSCGVLGMLLYYALHKRKEKVLREPQEENS